jgi:hypothetical protein
MKTGGSNYIKINGDSETPVIGTYHDHAELVESNITEMFSPGGQRKIALLLWFAPLNFPAAREHLWHHVCDSFGGALCQQHQENVVSLLAVIAEAGFNELHFRFGPQGKAMDNEWSAWDAAQFNENWNLISSTRNIVDNHKLGLKVTFDLGVEHANERMDENAIHSLYCRRMWKLYTEAYGAADSCGFSILHGGSGLDSMLRLFKRARLPFPSSYCFDAYDAEYAALVSAAAVLGLYPGELVKPVYMLETNYNDATSCADIKRAVQETLLNFGGIIQWPKIRDRDPHDFPDLFPRCYDNYLVDV